MAKKELGVTSNMCQRKEYSPSSPPKTSLEGFRGGHAPRPNDVFIAVMGVTGSGKSSFISICSSQPVRIGHSLDACTSTVDAYPFDLSPDCTVYLIDTPGFDDTNKRDTEVLSEIAAWLSDSYRNKILLHGIIYLHRITDVRMQGSAKKNLILFKKLCGQDALKKVILATTMWDKISDTEAAAREEELINTPDFWGWMLGKGSSCQRHDNTAISARRIVGALATNGRPITTTLQKQLVDEQRTLDQTSAGQELHSELIKEREKCARDLRDIEKQMQEAIKQRDRESEEALLEERDRYTRMIERVEKNTYALRSSMEKLIAQRDQRVTIVEQQLKQLQVTRYYPPSNGLAPDIQSEDSRQRTGSQRDIEQDRSPQPERAKQDQGLDVQSELAIGARWRKKIGGGQVKKTWYKNPLTHLDYSVALNGGTYILRSRSNTTSNIPSIDTSRLQFGCIGSSFGESIPWVARYTKKNWVGRQVAEFYPDLGAKISDHGIENLDICALGPDQTYYARWLDGNWSCWASDEIIAALEHDCVQERGYEIIAVALGYGGSYVVSYADPSYEISSDHPKKFRCNLKGYYPKLQQFLTHNKGLRIKGQAISLDPKSQHSYIMVYTHDDNSHGRENDCLVWCCSDDETYQGITGWLDKTQDTLSCAGNHLVKQENGLWHTGPIAPCVDTKDLLLPERSWGRTQS